MIFLRSQSTLFWLICPIVDVRDQMHPSRDTLLASGGLANPSLLKPIVECVQIQLALQP
jgi:hypothetical protein